MKRLIVTADDFGLTNNVNKGIIEGHCDGIVTSASLMANGEAFADAVDRVNANPQLAIGIHLNLTEGRPAAEKNSALSLLNSNGVMRSTPGLLARRIAAGKVRTIEIETELRAQIEKTIAAGLAPSYVDGHKHVQLIPRVLGIVTRLAKEYGIPAIRCAVEPARLSEIVQVARGHGSSGVKQFMVSRGLSLLARKGRHGLKEAGLATPDYFLGITATGYLDINVLTRILNELPQGTTELMTHPGYLDADLSRTPTRLLKQREQELRILTADSIKRLIQQNGIELISYRQLPQML